ncbi:MAG: 50S ribosomal protein L37ae [Candidatus Nanoarchaeia archaeon]
MAHTKKVGAAGRFGARYGLKIRKAVAEIEAIQRAKHKCPSCLKLTLKRIACGIWKCAACGAKYAGNAYEPGLDKALVVQKEV